MASIEGETFVFGAVASTGTLGLAIFAVMVCTGKLSAGQQAKCELACAPRVGVVSCETAAYPGKCVCACADEENVRPVTDVKVSREFK